MTIQNDTKTKYHTVEQLAKYTSLSVPTIRRYMRSEGLPHFRINRRILIDIGEFDRWMEERRQKQAREEKAMDRLITDIVDDFRLRLSSDR